MSASRQCEPRLPITAAAITRALPAFEAWLLAHGSALKKPTNPYEVLRFIGIKTECVVYKKFGEHVSSWENGADDAYRAFLAGTEWRAVEKGSRDMRKRANTVASLAMRDGWSCAFCPVTLTPESATIEHFFPIVAGGSSHMANLSLACGPCNKSAGHLSVREKLEIAVKNRTYPVPHRQDAEAVAGHAPMQQAGEIGRRNTIDIEMLGDIVTVMSDVHAGNAREAQKTAIAVGQAIAAGRIRHVTIKY